mgnify:CR=1 FL=1
MAPCSTVSTLCPSGLVGLGKLDTDGLEVEMDTNLVYYKPLGKMVRATTKPVLVKPSNVVDLAAYRAAKSKEKKSGR